MSMYRFLVRATRDSRGFTLAEAVLAAGLAVLVLLAALEVSWRVWGLVGSSRARFDEEAELRNAAYWVTRDLRRAEAVDGAAPGRLELTVGGNTVAYTLDGGSLVREEGGTKRAVARGLAAADFSAEERDGGVLVTAEFRGQKGGVRACAWVYTGQ
jgi:hypothetical protein